MLTADLVRARRSGGELRLMGLSGARREAARRIASELLCLAADQIGRSRAEFHEELAALQVAANEHRLLLGLAKLVEDACTFSADCPLDPPALRRAVFEAASDAWRRLVPGSRFDRGAVLGAVASANGASPDTVDAALFADLRSAHVLLAVEPLTPDILLERYERAQVQAVLLRAVRVVADVTCRSAAAYRALFGTLKFRRLLHRITPREPAGYRIEIDGPYSLFDSVTKYGLELALVLPALEACDSVDLIAELRWGKQREPLAFRHSGGVLRTGAAGSGEAPALPDEVAALVEGVRAQKSAWSVEPTDTLLDLPGVGLCVPDLVFENREGGARIFFEVLGYWSRDAVWRRVELVQAGLGAPVLFAVSSRLRVSEELLGEEQVSALYVYKGTMSARAVLQKIEALAARFGAS